MHGSLRYERHERERKYERGHHIGAPRNRRAHECRPQQRRRQADQNGPEWDDQCLALSRRKPGIGIGKKRARQRRTAGGMRLRGSRRAMPGRHERECRDEPGECEQQRGCDHRAQAA